MLWENIEKSATFDITAQAIMGAGPMVVANKFTAKSSPSTGGCWSFSGSKTQGYSVISISGEAKYAHRVSALLHGMEIVNGLVIDHKCRNRWCVNPAHLQQVSTRTNILLGEGIAAKNAIKEKCKHGHVFTTENTYISNSGARQCRACIKSYQDSYRSKKKSRVAK